MKKYADLGRCYPPRHLASPDNTLLNLHNSSYHIQPQPQLYSWFPAPLLWVPLSPSTIGHGTHGWRETIASRASPRDLHEDWKCDVLIYDHHTSKPYIAGLTAGLDFKGAMLCYFRTFSKARDNGLVLLLKIIIRHWNCFLPSVA